MEPVLLARGVTKTYRNGKEALRGIDLEIGANRIYGLLGPNGAGKTTSLRILSTHLLPTAGEVRLFGEDAIRHPERVRPQIAVVPQEGRVLPNLTPWEHVYFYLMARSVPGRQARVQAEEALRFIGLWDRRKDACIHLSGGLRRRVLIAMVLATGARLMFLDEPTTGLDPIARRQTWESLHTLREKATILLTSHHMDEVEALSSSVTILHQGQVAASGRPDELMRLVPGKQKLLMQEGTLGLGDLRRWGQVHRYGGKLLLYPADREAGQAAAAEAMRLGVEMTIQPVTLEDVYVQVVGREQEKAEQREVS